MDALTKEILLFILEEITVDRKAALKLRDLRRRLQQLDKPVEQPEHLEPLCPH